MGCLTLFGFIAIAPWLTLWHFLGGMELLLLYTIRGSQEVPYHSLVLKFCSLLEQDAYCVASHENLTWVILELWSESGTYSRPTLFIGIMFSLSQIQRYLD